MNSLDNILQLQMLESQTQAVQTPNRGSLLSINCGASTASNGCGSNFLAAATEAEPAVYNYPRNMLEMMVI